MIAGGAVLAAAVVAGGAFVAISGGGDDKPGAGAATETPAATGTRPTTPAPTAVSPTSVPATPTSGATVAATNLPSVTAPAAVSRLRSGVTARALLPVNMLQDPSGSSTVVRLLAPGARVVVVTNTPAASTVVTTEGLIFWRVVVEGTTVVGWIPEVTVDGATRFLDTVQ